ncbi:MAG: hypothetical protein KAT17_03500 [Candidatus Aminicenantes bacterium]|nr:hypothetical protein [Candidatus Aminicenantes bacterium]
MIINRRFFFNYLRNHLFGGRLSQSEVDGMEFFLDYWEDNKDTLVDYRWLSYILGTVYHETGKTFQPLREWGKGRGRPYGEPDPETGQIYYGRGYIQLTWKENYEKYKKILKVDLVKDPDLALKPELSTKITFHGMINGTFTGKKLRDFFNKEEEDWYNARKIVNPKDFKTFQSIEDYSLTFYAAIGLIP